MDLEQIRALVNPYGYRAQWYPAPSTHHVSVWPTTMEAFCCHEEFVINLLTLAGLTLLDKKLCEVEDGSVINLPACLIFNPPTS